jgi:hypothetical protein
MSEPAGLLSIRSCRIRYRIEYRFPNTLRAAATSETTWIGSTNNANYPESRQGDGESAFGQHRHLTSPLRRPNRVTES